MFYGRVRARGRRPAVVRRPHLSSGAAGHAGRGGILLLRLDGKNLPAADCC